MLFCLGRLATYPLRCRRFGTNLPTAPRLAITHSSHIPGLVAMLRRLRDRLGSSSNVSLIVPGRLNRTKGKDKRFTLRLTTKTPNGFKALAKGGGMVQEVKYFQVL